MWLTKDDILEVRIKGTPGCKASFLNGIEMRELNTEESPRGIQGVYVGRYKVKETDELEEQPITFTLEKDGQAISKISNAMIAFMNKDFPLIAKTIDERSELNYGLGTNRLGGAKLSFIHEDIKLMIDGKVDDMFRVRLNENNIAWIPIDQVEILPYGTRVPNTLTETFTVWGDDRYDYVNVSIGEKLPFSSFQEPSERKIHIDIYGAVSNTNWITQNPTTKEIKNIYYNQIEENLLRITIELKHKQLWGYSVNYEGRGLQIKIKQQPKDLDLDNLKIVIDAGHGGPTNNGALGSTGLTEKEVNLSTALHLKKLLEDEGAKVVMTRSEDISVWNSERLKSAIEEEPDLLVSIHANSIGLTSDPTKTSGTSTYYKHIAFRPLSQKIYKRMLELGLAPYGNVGNFNFTLNSQTEMPNVLVELAFMSNPEDEILLMNDEFRKEMAEKIFEGIEDFLDWCED
jgi:N-acetylmuramoyl-L-alanine amidase